MAAPPGKGADDNPGMGKDELKKSLKLAKRRHMHVALALGGDGKPIIMMDKMKKGQPLYGELHKKAKDAKAPKWGEVEIDKQDPKRAIFILNKGGGGLARKLIVALKGTGYNKVTIKLEDGTVDEDEAGEDDGIAMDGDDDQDDDDDTDQQGVSADAPAADDETTQQSASSSTDQAAQPAQSQDTTDTTASPDTSSSSADQTTQQNGQLDAGTLAKQLTGLVQQMVKAIAADPTTSKALSQLAISARESLKQGDLQGASAAMDNLQSAMGQGGASTDQSSSQPAASNGSAQPDTTDASTSADASSQSNGTNGSTGTDGSTQSDTSAQPAQQDDDSLDANAQARAPAIAKAQTAWNATLQKIEGDLGKLHNAFGSAFKGHDQEEEIGKAFRSRVEGVMQSFDKELHQVLESVNKARGRKEREEMVRRAHEILARHRKQVQSDQTIVQIDANPFVSMSIGKTLGTTIDALTRAIR
jgi:hypothetical protein